jgi:RNA polymerase sigma-70 factor (ECF subfamily)
MDEVLDDKVVAPIRSPPESDRARAENDRVLIGRLIAGEATALAALDSWIQVVLRTEFHSLHDEWDDLRQEIRLRVFRNLRSNRFHGASELRTYVHRIARNTCIDMWRRSVLRRARSDAAAGGQAEAACDDASERLITRDLLRKILLGSTPEERHLLEMVHAEHLSYAEIARRLGVAEGTIKARVFRCRGRLLAVRRQLLRIGGR